MERKPWAEIAEQSGHDPGTLRNPISKVHKSGTFSPFKSPNAQKRSQRDQRGLELRLKENLFNKEISDCTSLQGSAKITYGQQILWATLTFDFNVGPSNPENSLV
ncbi:MAG: hypothetical protein OXD43_02905 [Bacteroidetes bacterium]|nr:hypothetical protein [Bacteroidota bacterium]